MSRTKPGAFRPRSLRVCTAGFRVHVLCAQFHGRTFEGFASRFQCDERRADHDVDIVDFSGGRDDFADECSGIGGGLVHLPIPGDKFFAWCHVC